MYTNEWDPNNGAILRSLDQGATWTKTALPFKVGGNMPGRGIGEVSFETRFVDQTDLELASCHRPKQKQYSLLWGQKWKGPVQVHRLWRDMEQRYIFQVAG